MRRVKEIFQGAEIWSGSLTVLGAVVGKLTADADGNASVGGLLRDNYTIRKLQAPKDMTNQLKEIKIGSQDFGTDKSVSRDIIVRRHQPKGSSPLKGGSKWKEIPGGTENL